MRRKLLLAFVVLVAGWNAWRAWVHDPPDMAERLAGDLPYHASLLAVAANDDSSCTASLRGLRLARAEGAPGTPALWRDVRIHRPYTTPSDVEAGRAFRPFEAGAWVSQEIRVERLELRVGRRLTDSARLAALRYVLASGASDFGGSGDREVLRDEHALILETAPDGPGEVVTGCYGMYEAADRCRGLGGRVVTDSLGVPMERCTFVEGDSGRTFDDLLERRREGG